MGKIYVDSRGWLYRVMAGIVEDSFKARYCKPDVKGEPRDFSTGWKGVASLSWRTTQEEAEQDLDAYAKKHDMRIWKEVQASCDGGNSL